MEGCLCFQPQTLTHPLPWCPGEVSLSSSPESLSFVSACGFPAPATTFVWSHLERHREGRQFQARGGRGWGRGLSPLFLLRRPCFLARLVQSPLGIHLPTTLERGEHPGKSLGCYSLYFSSSTTPYQPCDFADNLTSLFLSFLIIKWASWFSLLHSVVVRINCCLQRSADHLFRARLSSRHWHSAVNKPRPWPHIPDLWGGREFSTRPRTGVTGEP